MKKIHYLFSGLTALTVMSLVTYFYVNNSSPIPTNIQKQVSFAIFYPTIKDVNIDKSTFKYDTNNKSVSYIVEYSGKKITFAQQSSPEAFVDDPNYYPKFAEKLNNYVTFETINGRVDLTRPTKIDGQTGLMNSKGTLVFAKSDSDISEDDWKRLFNSLVFTNPNLE